MEWLSGSAAGTRRMRGGGRSVAGVCPQSCPVCDRALSWEEGQALIQGAGLRLEVLKC